MYNANPVSACGLLYHEVHPLPEATVQVLTTRVPVEGAPTTPPASRGLFASASTAARSLLEAAAHGHPLGGASEGRVQVGALLRVPRLLGVARLVVHLNGRAESKYGFLK